MRLKGLVSQLAGATTLSEPQRLEIYQYVVSKRVPVSRDEAAKALKISRALAAFHLDKLAEQGFLETSFKRLSKRSGPGAGRPAKLYARGDRDLSIHIPGRRYDLAGLILVRAVASDASGAAANESNRVAREVGESIAEECRERAGQNAKHARVMKCTMDRLAEMGYEPFRNANGDVLLANCPFHSLAQENTPLVCGLNLALMQGLVNGASLQTLTPELDPQTGMCCVVMRNRGSDEPPNPHR